MPSLQRVPMLVCLLVELKNIVAVAVGCFHTRPLRSSGLLFAAEINKTFF